MGKPDDSDADRRRNEMNMFSAFARGGGDLSSALDDSTDHSTAAAEKDDNISRNLFDSGSMHIPPKKTEEARQKDEMAAFSAAAGGGGDLSSIAGFSAAAGGGDLSSIAGFSAAARGGGDLSSIAGFSAAAGGGEDLSSIAGFSAAARGGGDLSSIAGFSAAAGGGGDLSSIAGFSAAAGGGDLSSISGFSAAANSSASDTVNLYSGMDSGTFAKKPPEMDSGTFNVTSSSSIAPSQRSSDVSYLDQAAAALALGFDDDDDDDVEKKDTRIAGLSWPIPVSGADQRQQKMEPDFPMYNEEVRMQRPLFFGPLVPPRVLNEARQIVNKALQDQGYDGLDPDTGEVKDESKPLPRLSSLPPEVQNIVGTLRVYGHGLSAFPTDSKKEEDEAADSDKPFWKGSSYVSSFQPVFGDTARMFRQQQGMLVNTAPPPPEDNAQPPSEGQPQQSSGAVSQEASSNNNSGNIVGNEIDVDAICQEEANAAFLKNISNQAGTSPQNQTIVSTAKKAVEPKVDPAKRSEIDLFSMLARGEGGMDDSVGAAADDNNSQGSFGSLTKEKDKNAGVRKQMSNVSDLSVSTHSKPHIPQNGVADSDDGGKPMPMLNADVFAQWARGESPANKATNGTFSSGTMTNTFVMREKAALKKPPSRPQFPFGGGAAGTFQRIPATNLNDSDDDSIVGSELKKKVGVNEHLDRALASLVDEGLAPQTPGDEDETTFLPVMRATEGGRPLSNIELTNGCVPIFGVDNAPLPVEGDLGIHETKNDEQRTAEQKRSQEIIDKYVGPNVFGPVACPNPATSPDDNHSWNSRSAPSHRYNAGGGAGGGNPSDRVGVPPATMDTAHSPKPPPAPNRKTSRNQSPRVASRSRNHASAAMSTPVSRKTTSKATAPPSSAKRGGRLNTRHRFGWWSPPESLENGKGGVVSSDHSVISGSEQSNSSSTVQNTEASSQEDPLQLPPLYHASQNVHIDTRLQPGPEKLKEENLPLSDLHSATALANALPYLSDRPPSYRYLQIDTQAVGFPPLGADVEPLFCSLAIYNVETTPGNDHGSTPRPDLQRCGRVTEVLNFDVVTDPQVEESCIGSLWPFFASSTMTPQTSKTGSVSQATQNSLSSNPSLQGTRCGVFPLPSNLNVANLYAVLIVQKVLAEDADFEIYLKQTKSSKSSGGFDLNKFRTKAEKASNQHGSFLIPFAFGVAPLLQVFGADNPVVASSRAVQIPLFRFSAGQGERQIIDHIMVMLYPRADFRANGIGGPAAVTNGGTAMLVMRNFGYLGLHAVVHSRSSLARDRLVDFTGEVQIRRRNEQDPPVNKDAIVKRDDQVYVVPQWHPQFIAEPTVNGGRNSVDPFDPYSGKASTSKLEKLDGNPSRSQLYAQELAPVSLASAPFAPTGRHPPSSSASPRARAPVNRSDIEPYYHTTFCNELLCHPRLLHSCPKGNIVMKVEMRELEWSEAINGYVAHLPSHGPSIHNNRRGPFLIQGTYTSCAARSSDPKFLDEVKVKLPLELNPRKNGSTVRTLSLFFSVYHVKFKSSKKKWSKVLPIRSNKRDPRVSGVNDVDEATGERSEHGDDDRSGKCKLVSLACGFLPITSHACLIDNGLHDVKMMYKARPPTSAMRSKDGIPSSCLIVTEKSEASIHSQRDSQASSGVDPKEDETTTGSSKTYSETEHVGGDESDDGGFSETSDRSDRYNDASSHGDGVHKTKTSQGQMSLQVRIVVHSSLHVQNAILRDFLHNETDYPGSIITLEKGNMQVTGLSREEIVRQFSAGAVGLSPLTASAEERLVNSVVSVAKPSLCSPHHMVKHLLRIVPKVWRTLICGTGDLAWANPASIIPLRVHAFASLLQIVGNASGFMSKSGVTQVDGVGKFDPVTLARVMSWVYDEESLFGGKVKELVGDIDVFLKSVKAAKSSKKEVNSKTAASVDDDPKKEKAKRRRRHQRSNFELFNDNPRRADSIDMSDPTSDFGELVSGLQLPTTNDLSTQHADAPAPQSRPPRQRSPPPPAARNVSPSPDKELSSAGDFDFASLSSLSDTDSITTPDATSAKPAAKVDSKFDFQSNLELGLQNDDEGLNKFDAPLTSSNTNHLVQLFGGMSGTGKKKYMTAPASRLATIREDDDDSDVGTGVSTEGMPLSPLQPSTSVDDPDDSVASELVITAKKAPKMFRRPKVTGRAAPSSPKKSLDSNPLNPDPPVPSVPEPLRLPEPKHKYATISGLSSLDPHGVPPTKGHTMSAGGAFFDSLFSDLNSGDLTGGPPNGGKGKHKHRKTQSRCSYDWSLPGDEPVASHEIKAPKPEPDAKRDEDNNDDQDESMSTLELEEENCIHLPSYIDRLVVLGAAPSEKASGRWFPYTYEVVICMWTAFLVQQRSKGNVPDANSVKSAQADDNASLAAAASGCQRGTVACAPLLFEIIKQSLGFRVRCLMREIPEHNGLDQQCPPLVVLDDTLQSSLERLVSMVTDACLNSRNFDSRDVRQMSIDVNDSIVRFLRDMFGFLSPKSVHRLIIVYLSRFVTNEGKQWQDRDSSIGLRCSWEITKLRLNAMTALIRFPDFLRVCSPQMNNWGTRWTSLQGSALDSFFDGVMQHFKKLELGELAGDGGLRPDYEVPKMRPHWLAELVTEICLNGIVHAEQYIQQRAASLLHELFWTSSQHSMGNGTSAIVASMYASFLEKVVSQSSYLSNFPHKSQLRKDILPCVVFVLQSAPNGLLRAIWRKLCFGSIGKGSFSRYGEIGVSLFPEGDDHTGQEQSKNSALTRNEPDILDMFTLLNLTLSTMEYEGCEDLLESDAVGGGGEVDDQIGIWHKEYLLTQGKENQQPFMSRRPGSSQSSRLMGSANDKGEKAEKGYFSSGSRKWQSHDGAVVIVNCGNQIVTELAALLQQSGGGQTYLNRSKRSSMTRASTADFSFAHFGSNTSDFNYSRADTVIFVRAATSLYLHALALRQSDIVLVRTFKVSGDLVKMFGIKVFLEAVGETLQHWMRVISMHCGARRAVVRIEATDFLELILRCTWENFGSFFRIRIPLLAVQTEVMERIVAIASARYYREERRTGSNLDNFSNASAEASLAPLWRTLDRLHTQCASQNVAFRGALVRLAEKLKRLYRAYIAARALSYLNGMRSSPKHAITEKDGGPKAFSATDALVRAYRITVLRVINASAGYSKQFLGFHGTSLSNSSVAHYEAVEDAFLEAAAVFSPTELPEHRVAWLQMLVDFHKSRKRLAEEGTCHFRIYATLKQASSLHGSLWSNTPFLPWTHNQPDSVHIDGEAPTGNPLDYGSDLDLDELGETPYGKQLDDANSSRRIFYRVANSVRANTEDWETGLSKTLFSGVTFAAEYCSVSSWITLKEMEEKMVEHAVCAGDLFLQAGIIESCRYSWNLATQYYAEKFSYGKLANVYGCLARAVVSRVPPIDASTQQEVSISLGRFYRVWFHGGAPDELIGAEFVYRTASWIRLDQFGDQLREVIKCIIPDRTPIHLVLDGRVDEGSQRGYTGFSRLGPAPLEPVRIKVTPLRPLYAKGSKVRGLPEWFHRYIDEMASRATTNQSSKRHRGGLRSGVNEEMGRVASPGHRGNNLSFGSSASVFASSGSSASGSMFSSRRSSLSRAADGSRVQNSATPTSAETELVGVDKFGFLQPAHIKDRNRANKDWWKPPSGDFARKSLRVTQLQVGQAFPACVTRQAVVHRVVFNLSPLEAASDGVCQWCSVLFRTAVATNGMAVLGINGDPGIGTDAAKVVTDCIHSSRVKEMGMFLLKKNVAEEDSSDFFQNSDRLTDEEVKRHQSKLSRTIVVFLELLHLLIARNRDLLLNLIQERRKEPIPPPPPTHAPVRSQTAHAATSGFSGSVNPRNLVRLGSQDGSEPRTGFSRSVTVEAMRGNVRHDDRSTVEDQPYAGSASLAGATANVRSDAAIAVQSELQRSYISMVKSLYPGLSGIMQTDTPGWLRKCCQENYFSLGAYRQARIPISEELYFTPVNDSYHQAPGGEKLDQNGGRSGLSSDYLHDRAGTESPSGTSVASSSVFSGASGHMRYGSKQAEAKLNEF
ncbi:expressed unknown protein [Seminavis robusta]|uniref:C2 DOCK-type domain-containing protein n=1 Tax=Seminavis robusta TaxID=568900 RepID=A0A9N8DV35_9STRA|nr:expressed unknown protein [Seminavis robusta]|eukprot:Sro379_g130530.1 n/a (4021) ;mRNA; f:55205-68019